ncbi:multidrug effflux MFS transporter [Pigmentiphaga aceris]|uniref:Bcr/CflA family efflux transporter n=1 Tax=Pigmentiphaga aceris TaxID=1940612 RepID=A0A5C0AY61_9BURK|nr:multidrug effflux MFS transporter [Pigmentiphaga aceris]QEI05770.1 multidrug effflux MFS transporter [Pigmentiphaga aceris]
MKSSFFRTALVLGLLSAIGPFAIDMYLPALPAIALDLKADTRLVQTSLMAFFVATAISQLAYGPAADMYGRKAPLYAGIGLFAIASIGCALASNIETLVAFRFLQGLGAGAGVVVPRAIVRDLHTGPDAARLMSTLMLVFSVSPILAPLAGSLLIEFSNWRGIFWAVTVAAAAGLALTATALPETRPPALRLQSNVRGALAGYAQLMRDRHFLGVTFIGAFGMSSFFIYLANSSFVLIGHYSLSTRMYSLAFSANALAFIGAAQLTSAMSRRMGLSRVIGIGITGCLIVVTSLFLISLAGVDSLLLMAAMLFVGFGFLGLVVPTTAVLAMELHGRIAGTASALMGTLQLVTGAVMIAIVSRFVDGTAVPMLGGIALCALIAAVIAFGTLRGRSSHVAASAKH